MSRLVTERPPAWIARTVSETREDTYPERVAKYVPAEIIAGYTPLMALAAANGGEKPTEVTLWLAGLVFLAGFIATPLYLWRVSGKVGKSKPIQIVIATIAFPLWAYVLGGPFEVLSEINKEYPYHPEIGGVVTGIYTWMVGLFAPVASEDEAAERAKMEMKGE